MQNPKSQADKTTLADVDLAAFVESAENEAGISSEQDQSGVPPSRRRKTTRPYTRSGKRYQGKPQAGETEGLPPLIDSEVTDLLQALPPEDLNKIVLEGMGGAIRGLTKLLGKLIAEGMEADETESLLYARYIKAYLTSMPDIAGLLQNPKALLWLVLLNYLARRLDILYTLGEKLAKRKEKVDEHDTFGQG